MSHEPALCRRVAARARRRKTDPGCPDRFVTQGFGVRMAGGAGGARRIRTADFLGAIASPSRQALSLRLRFRLLSRQAELAHA